jgi:hypothetical protein
MISIASRYLRITEDRIFSDACLYALSVELEFIKKLISALSEALR